MDMEIKTPIEKENKINMSFALIIGLIAMFSIAYNSDLRVLSWLWYGLSAGVIFVLFLEVKKRDFFKIISTDFYSKWAIAFFGFFTIALLWATNRSFSIDSMKTLVLIFAVNVLLAQLIKNKNDFNVLLFVNFIALIALMVYVLFKADFARWTIGFQKLGSVRLGSETLGENWNSNDLGIKLCIGFTLAFHYILSPINLNLKTIYKVLIKVLLFIIACAFLVLSLLSGSKKVIIMIVLISCLLAFLRAKKYKLLILLVLAIGVFGLVFAVMKIQTLYETIGIRFVKMIEELKGTSTHPDGSSIERISMIKLGFELFKQKPILGYGLNCFRAFSKTVTWMETYSHNNFIEILVSGGIVGFLVYYSVYVYIFVKLFKPAVKERDNIAILLFTVNFVYFVIGFALVSYAMTLTNVFLLLGAVYARLFTKKSKRFEKISKAIKNPKFAIKHFKTKYLNSRFGKKLDDKTYLEKRFKLEMGKSLDLENPKTYNEKLQWLKLYDRKPLYTTLVDKYKVREWVAEKIGEEHLIPLLGVWDNVNDIDFDSLPNEFVLKCNHNSGLGMCICKDKASLDIEKVKTELKKGLNQNYYLNGREWPYKDVPRKIIAEKFMVDESGYELKDYKFFCFNGKVKLLFVAKDRNKIGEETKFDFFNENFVHLSFTNGHPNSEPPYIKPENFEEMKRLAEILSENIPQVRVDFYNINGKIYFGEMTFFHWSGFVPFEPQEWDLKLGKLIKLPNKKS